MMLLATFVGPVSFLLYLRRKMFSDGILDREQRNPQQEGDSRYVEILRALFQFSLETFYFLFA